MILFGLVGITVIGCMLILIALMRPGLGRGLLTIALFVIVTVVYWRVGGSHVVDPNDSLRIHGRG